MMIGLYDAGYRAALAGPVWLTSPPGIEGPASRPE
jgi:hypothetical protein